jgi:hypothetical protein
MVLLLYFSLLVVGVRAGVPGTGGSSNNAVLVVVDGMGAGHAFRGGIPNDSDGEARWTRSLVATPAGDSAMVASSLSTGCDESELRTGGVSVFKGGSSAEKLSQLFRRSGGSYGVVTSKCVDDGTSSPFIVSSFDRYDLKTVGFKISTSVPPPKVLSGGFSRNLWNAAASNGSAFVEFASRGEKAFAEICEYPAHGSFAPRAVGAVERLLSTSSDLGFLLVLVFTGVDTASHKGGGAPLDEQLSIIKNTVSEVESPLEANGGNWKMVVVGSHDTGGSLSNGTLSHARHSAAGTLVPLFTRGVGASDVARTSTMAGVSRLISTKSICSRERSSNQRSDVVYRHGTRHGEMSRRDEGAFVWFFFMMITGVAIIYFVVTERRFERYP